MKPAVIGSAAPTDARSGLRVLASAPAGCALVELRADHLRRGAVTEIVQGLERPVIVTVRRGSEGGAFDGSEEERLGLLEAALEAGAAFVDVEWGSSLAQLAHGPRADRVILSSHGTFASPAELDERFEEMARTGAARLKIVPRARHVAEAPSIRDLLARARSHGHPLACFASGREGALTRLLAPAWGSWATYGSLPGAEATAEGQFSVAEMLGVHDVLGFERASRHFAIVGSRVFGSPTPAMHVAAAAELGIAARCFPIESDHFEPVAALTTADCVGIEAMAMTMPFKEEAARRCELGDETSRASGAVNTVLVEPSRWVGFNTDGPAMRELVASAIPLEGTRIAIAGAGGTARAAAGVFRDAGASVRVFNRGRERRAALEAALGVPTADLAELARAEWDVLIQATPLGRGGEEILPRAGLNGRVVLDAVYGSEATPLVRDARACGLVTFDGLDLLVDQAVLQLEHILGRRPSRATLRAAAQGWLAERGR